MILDRLENWNRYPPLHRHLAMAFHYLLATDLTAMAPGRYPLAGEELFAIVNQYETKKISSCPLEGHRKYIDLQYMVEGMEWIGYAPLHGQPVSAAPEPEEDCFYYDGESSLFRLAAGMFAIFYPADLHRPCIGEGTAVKKVVIKIAV